MSNDDDPAYASTRDERVPRWRLPTADHGVREPASATTTDAPTSIAQFEIEHELGRGGMGVVFAATDTALSRRVAIKQALTHRGEDLERFEREVRITAHLEHPSIVPVYEAGRDATGQPFYVMRQIDGERLTDRVARATTLDERLALLPTVVAVIDAAAYAHAHAIIHRDIKPHNILLGAHGETFLIDWGLARELDRDADVVAVGSAPQVPQSLTRAGQVYGTVGFMAPEQARGEPVDRRADVYALGVTLAFVLCGKLPEPDVPAVALLDRRLPSVLTAIVEKASARLPDARYRDAGALAADLRSFLAGQLVGAYRYTWRERLTHVVRRHRIAIGLTTALIVAATAVGGLALQNLVHERDLANLARREAEEQQRLASDRAEVALLDRASLLASRDPARAAALLRQLPSSSPHIARARDIAESAALAGIAHGLKAHTRAIHAMAWSPDGTWLATGGADGTLQLHDRATRRSRIVFRGEYVNRLVWGSATAVAFVNGPHELHVFDTDTNTERTIDPQIRIATMWASQSGERLRYHDPVRRVVAELPFLAGPEVVLARDVDDAFGEGDVVIVKRGVRFELEDGAGMHALPALAWQRFAISPDRRRVAGIVGRDEVVEWEISTGRTQRWPIARPLVLFYVGAELLASQSRALLRLHEDGMSTVASGNWELVRTTEIRDHERAIATDDGKLWTLDRFGRRALGIPTTNAVAVAGRSGTSMLAVGTVDGTIYWWDLAAIPREQTYEVEVGNVMCGLDATRIVLTGKHGVTVIERATGEIRSKSIRVSLACENIAGRYAVLTTPDGERQLLDLETGELVHHLGPRIAYDDHGNFLEIAGTTLRERTSTNDIVRWNSPGEIIAAQVQGRWIAAQAGDGTVIRIDRTTGERHTYANQPLADNFALSVDGIIWIVSGGILSRVDANGVTSFGPTRMSPKMLYAWGDRAILVDQDNAMVAYTPNGTVLLSSGQRREVQFAGRTALAREPGRLVTYFLDTGEVTIRETSYPIFSSSLSQSGEVAILGSNRLVIFRPAGPATPADLHAWLDAATNAVLDNGTLTWR